MTIANKAMTGNNFNSYEVIVAIQQFIPVARSLSQIVDGGAVVGIIGRQCTIKL